MTLLDWQILFLSILPVTELRATIPLALTLGMSPLRAYGLAVTGNLLPVIPALLLIDPVSRWLRYIPPVDRIFQKILQRTRKKTRSVEKYGVVGLFLFVAVPFPITGAWTGIIIAWLLGMNIAQAALAISCGVALAGVLVTLASLGVIKMALHYDIEYFLVILLVILCLRFWYKNWYKNRKKRA